MSRISVMRIGRDRRPVPRFLATAQLTVAGLALLGTAATQLSWLVATDGPLSSISRPRAVMAILATTAWLISVAWFHYDTRFLGAKLTEKMSHVAADLIVASLATWLLYSGLESSLSLAGLWLLPPVLLPISATSAAVLAIAAFTASNRTGSGGARLGIWRVAIFVTLMISLSLLAKPSLPAFDI